MLKKLLWGVQDLILNLTLSLLEFFIGHILI